MADWTLVQMMRFHDVFVGGLHICPTCLSVVPDEEDGKMLGCNGCTLWVCQHCGGKVVPLCGHVCRACVGD